MGRILLVYDTKGGTTGEIIGWIKDGAESQGASVDIRMAHTARSLDYDLIVVGTPIYNERPMKSVRDFLRRDDLRNRRVALFVVCFAGVFGMRNFMVRRYLEELKRLCTGTVVKQTSFDSASGPWRKLNRSVCVDFGKELVSIMRPQPAAVEAA
jgi:menaquinone-dependent protoporphyrinogen oxidase